MKWLTWIAFILAFGHCSDSDPQLTEKPAPFPVVELGDFPGEARIFASGFSVKGKGYICGGIDCCFWGMSHSTKRFNELWEYTPASNKWVRRADHPVFYGLSPTTIDDTVYFLDTAMALWAYDASTDNWTKKNDFPGILRDGFVTMTLFGKIYVGLGWNSLNSSCYNDWWEYDPSTNSWSQKSNVPFEARYLSLCWSVSNHGYLAFGHSCDGQSVEDSFFNDFWEYDPIKDGWIERNTKGLSGYMLFEKLRNVLTIDGKPSVLSEDVPDSLHVYQYDFRKEEWKPQFAWGNESSGGMATFSIGSSHYFVFGQNTTGTTPGSSNKVWVLNDQ